MSLRRAVLAVLALCAFVAAAVVAPAFADDDDPDKGKPQNGVVKRADRYTWKPPGTQENLRFYFGPYLVPPGHDANRVDVDLPLRDGFIVAVEPGMRRAENFTEPSHQEGHIHHAHWFALDPGNKEDNYTNGNTEWIFGNGDEETKADFQERSGADPKGPIYGQYIGAGKPQAMIYMLHNKTSAPLNVYIVLDVTFIHGTQEQLNSKKMRAAAHGRPYRDLKGVLFGRTFDVPRNPAGDGRFSTTRDHKSGPIEWVATEDGTIIGTGSHLHPGGTSVITENMGSKENPCPNDGRGTGGTLMLKSDAMWRYDVPFTEDFQMEVSHPHWRAPVHKGDRIRITGYYANKNHAWYTAMTHQGLYFDPLQKPQGRCAPYLINQPEPKVTYKKVKKKVFFWKKVKTRSKKTGRVRVKLVRKFKVKVVKKKIVEKRLDPTEGVQNRPWPKHVDPFCGVELKQLACEREERARPDGQLTSTVNIANFLYLPGDLSRDEGFPKVKQGTSLQFLNVDQSAGIRHSVTTCTWPCNGRYVANYPLADGVWDSTTLGYDPIDGGNPNPVAATPPDLKAGKYSYFCRIHPWMRGAFEVVP
jgi:plastocyanin